MTIERSQDHLLTKIKTSSSHISSSHRSPLSSMPVNIERSYELNRSILLHKKKQVDQRAGDNDHNRSNDGNEGFDDNDAVLSQ